MLMNNNSKTLIWDNIPEWAIYSLIYGIEEDLFLTDEDKELITKFIGENFPNGYAMSVDWESYKEFDRFPAFGNHARLIRSGSVTYKSENMRKITLSEYNAIPENYRGIWTVERWDLPDWAELRKNISANVP